MNCKPLVLIALFFISFANAQTPTTLLTPSDPASSQDAAPASPAPRIEIAVLPEKEHWTALPLDKSGLNPKAFNAVLLQKTEQPDYTRELIRVEWRAGDPIELTIVRPHGVAKPPVILYLYDQTSDTDRFRSDSWCKQATQGGYAAVGFVSALAGQRFHAPRPMKEWFVSEMQEALGTSTHDVQMILNYLAQNDTLDASEVAMFGQGSGGSIAILAASVDPRIVALDLVNPWGDWPDWLKDSPQIPDNERATYLKPQFLAGVSSLDPVLYLPHLNLKALRVQQMMTDPVTPPAARAKIAAAAPKPEDVVQYKDVVASVKAYRLNGLSGWLRLHWQPSSTTVVASNHP